jgi:hypothetical protein
MTVLNNLSSVFLALSPFINPETMLEKRMDYEGGSQVVYIGYTQIANASQTAPVWFIVKCNYDGNGNLNYYQLPNAGLGFVYAWSARASYFA